MRHLRDMPRRAKNGFREGEENSSARCAENKCLPGVKLHLADTAIVADTDLCNVDCR